jgi:uncharacterized protein YndB with AHSA1/START domain
MEMQASRTLAVSQQQAWEALNDPEVLKLCIPGCDKVEATGENQYAVAMALKIGPVSAKFAGKITLSDIVPPESYTIAFDGSGGVAGLARAMRRSNWCLCPRMPLGRKAASCTTPCMPRWAARSLSWDSGSSTARPRAWQRIFSSALTTKCKAAIRARRQKMVRHPPKRPPSLGHWRRRRGRIFPPAAFRFGCGWWARRRWC